MLHSSVGMEGNNIAVITEYCTNAIYCIQFQTQLVLCFSEQILSSVFCQKAKGRCIKACPQLWPKSITFSTSQREVENVLENSDALKSSTFGLFFPLCLCILICLSNI